MSFVLLLALIFSNPVEAIAYSTTQPAANPESISTNPLDMSSANASESIQYLKLRVLLGDTYRENFSNALARAQSSVSYIDIPFIATWSIGFTESFANIGPLPIDYCSLSNTVLCSDSVCGSGCNNNINNVIHHKNIRKNKAAVEYYIPATGYDIMLTLVSSPMCGIWSDDHATSILGVATRYGDYALVTNLPKHSNNVHTRIMQHEISHLFGCRDGYCTPGEDCIMNGGYDGVSLYSADIWCTSCSQMFNPDAQ